MFTPVPITTLIGTEDARFILNGISPIAKGDLKWRDALLVTDTVNSNTFLRPFWHSQVTGTVNSTTFLRPFWLFFKEYLQIYTKICILNAI